MHLAPSQILFSFDFLNATTTCSSVPSNSASIPPVLIYSVGSQLPKLQVFEKQGNYFALDNNSLRLYRELEASGQCRQIEVDVVSRSKIPPTLFERTVVAEQNDSEDDCSYSSDSDSSTENEQRHCYVDEVTCVVCSKTFPSTRELTEHMNMKRHFGCSTCCTAFTCATALDKHKDVNHHWSDCDCEDDGSE